MYIVDSKCDLLVLMHNMLAVLERIFLSDVHATAISLANTPMRLLS